MIQLTFPKNKVTTRLREDINEVFDVVRKRWLLLNPEDCIRKNMIQFLISKNYPASLFAVEKEIKVGELSRRCDIVVYSRNNHPFMIIECKEMKVSLSSKTLDQILRYHISVPATYLVITNGSYCYGFKKINKQFIEINEFPEYDTV